MSETTIAQATEIDIVRHKNFYFYNRREGKRTAVHGQPITRERAEEVIEANAGNVKIQTGTVRFDFGDFEFSWTAEILEDDSNE